jgi:hypothetical protein
VDTQIGFDMPPEDSEPVGEAIRHAVSDDDLVDRAAQLNARLAQECLDRAIIKPQVIAM